MTQDLNAKLLMADACVLLRSVRLCLCKARHKAEPGFQLPPQGSEIAACRRVAAWRCPPEVPGESTFLCDLCATYLGLYEPGSERNPWIRELTELDLFVVRAALDNGFNVQELVRLLAPFVRVRHTGSDPCSACFWLPNALLVTAQILHHTMQYEQYEPLPDEMKAALAERTRADAGVIFRHPPGIVAS